MSEPLPQDLRDRPHDPARKVRTYGQIAELAATRVRRGLRLAMRSAPPDWTPLPPRLNRAHIGRSSAFSAGAKSGAMLEAAAFLLAGGRIDMSDVFGDQNLVLRGNPPR